MRQYLNGFPAQAFETFDQVMFCLQRNPLGTYSKSGWGELGVLQYMDPLNLYRVTCVNENTIYNRKRLFHISYSLRAKVSTNRYSIAGFPSLYLSTSLELCCEEIRTNSKEPFIIASRFKLERAFGAHLTYIKVIELAIKPQDFLNQHKKSDDYLHSRFILPRIRSNPRVHTAYLLWYPLIAACSYIRVSKKDPFAVEYIVPQLLMQWIRKEMGSKKKTYGSLIGIRYFSCASERASEMGFNYVFPTSGQVGKSDYCEILSKTFKLTIPYFKHEYPNVSVLESALKHDTDLKLI